MKLLLIPDKFKGSLTAAQVRSAITEGVRQVFPTAGIASFEASDGGDGFLDVVRSVRKIETHTVSVEDPLGRKIPAPFLFDPVRGEAFVEMATASGLLRLAESEQSPLRTHTRGTGQLIRAAIRLGARKVFVGLGGSATNDGGCGIATVFGYRFLDKNDQELEPIGQNLGAITRILPPKDPNLYNKVEIIAVNDVSNPLWGPSGAAFVYAAQKGAFGAEISMLDSGLRQLDALVSEQFGMEAGGLQGAGAAGGAAFGLYAF
ncbi:MAG: glycerate kinase, partial [Robiginitalea sp.]